MQGPDRQRDIYLAGVSGRRPRVPVRFDALEAAAKDEMSRPAYTYIAAGAGNERTVRANREAFERWRIVPRMLRDVSERDTSIELFGRSLPSPFLLAPIGVLEMAHRDADLAVARAAAATGVPMVFSNQASVPMEDCAEAMGDAIRWFQLYWSRSNELVESLVGRAEACGCSAIVVTLDTTMVGWRTRDLDLAYLPFLRAKGIAQYTSDPVFQRLVDEDWEGPSADARPTPNLAALKTLLQVRGRRRQVERFIDVYQRPSLAWDDLGFLRERASLPILLKGILHPGDAAEAIERGMDGIVVSNHGGRQVDGGIATLDALPRVVEAVSGRVPVLMDSGIRSGADAFKALALGATAVLLGRPYAYGLAVGGEAGVREVIDNHLADFDLTMALAGYRSPAEIGSDALVRADD